jgi:hypothetical protein
MITIVGLLFFVMAFIYEIQLRKAKKVILAAQAELNEAKQMAIALGSMLHDLTCTNCHPHLKDEPHVQQFHAKHPFLRH